MILVQKSRKYLISEYHYIVKFKINVFNTHWFQRLKILIDFNDKNKKRIEIDDGRRRRGGDDELKLGGVVAHSIQMICLRYGRCWFDSGKL